MWLLGNLFLFLERVRERIPGMPPTDCVLGHKAETTECFRWSLPSLPAVAQRYMPLINFKIQNKHPWGIGDIQMKKKIIIRSYFDRKPTFSALLHCIFCVSTNMDEEFSLFLKSETE